MREINTHKVNGCSEDITVETDEKLTVGGANTNYWMTLKNPTIKQVDARIAAGSEPPINASGVSSFNLKFQDGPIGEVGTNGITHEALLAILIDRLQSFQRGEYACRENAIALTHLEDAMHWLQHRTRARVTRGVEGTHAK